MAKVILPLMSSAARGKVGPLIFNQHRGINTVKGFSSPTQPNTPAQLNARSRLAANSSAWAGLTDEQRAAWQQYAIDHLETDWTGHPKRLTSQNWYVRCNSRIDLVGGVNIATPPVTSAPDAPTGVAVTCAGGAGTPSSFAWTTPVAAGITFAVYHAGPISPGRIPRFEQASILELVGADSGSPEELMASTPAGRHGYWVVAIDEASGLASAPIFVELTVA